MPTKRNGAKLHTACGKKTSQILGLWLLLTLGRDDIDLAIASSKDLDD